MARMVTIAKKKERTAPKAAKKRYIPIDEPDTHEIHQKRAARKPTNGFAIAAFVSGLLGFLIPFLNVAAIIFGIIAIRDIHRHRSHKGHGLAVIGMLLGLASLLLVLIADVASLAWQPLFGQ